MTDLHVNITSTEMDLELFVNCNYNNKVRNALKKVKERYNITENYIVACYDSFIKIYTPKRELMLIQEF